jgi:toxin-antitoxin system PIN domain toxin
MTLSGPAYLFDTNIWLALIFKAHPFHALAQGAFLTATPDRRALFCRSTQQSVLRLLTTPQLLQAYGAAVTNRDAIEIVSNYLTKPSVAFAQEPESIYPRWTALADWPTASPKRWMDAYLAAFAIEAGLQLITTDHDFRIFPGLQHSVLTLPSAAASITATP